MTTTTGVNLDHVTAQGPITISGVTITNITHMAARPPHWANVPALPNHFLGRDQLVDDLVQRLLAGQSTALSAEGLPGVGKTTLAVVLAHHPAVLAHFSDGVLWAGLGPTPDVPSALAAWANALDVDVSDQPTPAARAQIVRNVIGQRRILLVIDDAWHADAAGLLRCGGPGCAHLLTTRNQAIARQFAGVAQAVSVPTLEDDPAFALLQALAPEACAADPGAARGLARAVDGLPLALELLGGYLAVPERSYFAELSQVAVAEMADAGRRLALATRRLGAVDGAELTLRETIALSLEGLPVEVVDAFHALGVFAAKPASFDLIAAKAVTEADAASLALLAGRNLLTRLDGEQLALHQVLADVARTALPVDAVERHRDYYLALVDEDREDWQRIGGVYAQVQQALAWQVERWPDDGRLLDFYNALHTYQRLQGLWADYAGLAEQCLAWAQAHGDQGNEARFLNELGYMYSALGDKQQALRYFEQALPLFRQVGDRGGEATTLNNIGGVYDDLGDKQQALGYFEQALPMYRQVGDRSGEAVTLNNIGGVHSDLGAKQQALVYFEQALPLRRQVGDRSGEAVTLNNIGLVHSDLGDKQQALVYYEQALPLRRQVGDRSGEAVTLNNIGLVHSDLGDKQQALRYYKQALLLSRQVGDRGGEATTLNNIGMVYSDLGDTQQALAYYEQALPLYRQAGHRRGEAATLNNFGLVYSALGDKQQALVYYEQALALHRHVGDRSGEAMTLNNIGAVYDAPGDQQQALVYYEQALPLHRHVGNRRGEATALTNIGAVYDDLGDKQQALVYYQQALPLRRQVGDRSGEATTLTNIGGVYFALGDKQQALVYYQQALPLFRQVGDRRGEAATLNNIGVIYSALGDQQQTLDYYEQALPLFRQVGDRRGEATTLAWLGHIAAGTKDFVAALDYYTQALDLLRRIGDRWTERLFRRNITGIYQSMGDLAAAEEQLHQVVALDEAIGHPDLATDRAQLARIQALRRQSAGKAT
jgi:tetratricopeptide (TPR) repeat protein